MACLSTSSRRGLYAIVGITNRRQQAHKFLCQLFLQQRLMRRSYNSASLFAVTDTHKIPLTGTSASSMVPFKAQSDGYHTLHTCKDYSSLLQNKKSTKVTAKTNHTLATPSQRKKPMQSHSKSDCSSGGHCWRKYSSVHTQQPAGPVREFQIDPYIILDDELKYFYDDIREMLTHGTSQAELDQIATYYFDGQGKALRPMVTILMAKAINYHLNKESRLLVNKQRQIALFSEMVHSASLVHDDVIDQSDFRRGKPSVNALWNHRKVTMAGDYILSIASILIARLRSDDVTITLSQILVDLVQGEFMQLGSKETENERFAHYLTKTYRKTASLIANALKATAVIAEADENVIELAFQYGRNIGLAFQLVDDMLDFVSSAETMGKPTAADLKLGLATAPVLFACEKYPELNPMIMRRFTEPGDVERAFELVHKSHGLEQTRFLAKKHCNEAIRLAQELSESPYQKGLQVVADLVINRMNQLHIENVVPSWQCLLRILHGNGLLDAMTTSDETVIGIGSVPGDFCHDSYEHPLLWCAEKKRLIERKNAEDSMRMWRRRKAEEMARREKEKQEYYELFLKHCPWGRPGGGAPNIDVRRKDITAIGLHSTPTLVTPHRLASLQPCSRYAEYFSQHKKCYEPITGHQQQHHLPHPHPHQHQHPSHHHHAPRFATHAHTVHHHLSESTRPVAGSTVTICEREISGPLKNCRGGGAASTQSNAKSGETLEITLKDHPSMSFRKKGHIDIEVRYKPPAPGKGRPILEKIVVKEHDKCPAVPIELHGPTPTEAAPKSPSKKKLTTKMEKPLSKEPWGKSGPGGKPWRSPKAAGSNLIKSLGWTNKEMLKELDQDNPVTPAEKHTFRKVRPPKKPQLLRCCDLCTCSCPAMLNATGSDSTLKPLKKCPPLHKKDIQAKVDTGKQKICPRLLRCAAAAAAGGDNQQTTTTDNSANLTTNSNGIENGGGVELVPLLARRRATNRPISLSSTDVTKRTASHDRIPTAADLRYLHDLNEQISQKRRSISTAQQLDRDLCNQHFETFETFWGRPGHGAPGEIKQKLKLDYLLYGDQGRLE